MERFKELRSIAGILQPGDGTRYEMVAVRTWDSIEVIVMNGGFFDKITFISGKEEPYLTYRNDKTNPWTIKAAKVMRNKIDNIILKGV